MRTTLFSLIFLSISSCKTNTGGQVPPVSYLERKLLQQISTDFSYNTQAAHYTITEKLKTDLQGKYAKLILTKDTAWLSKTFTPTTRAKTVQIFKGNPSDTIAGQIQFIFSKSTEDAHGNIHQPNYTLWFTKNGRISNHFFQEIIGRRID